MTLCECGHPRSMHGYPMTWYSWIPLPPEGVCSHIAPPGTMSIKAVQEGCGCHGWKPSETAKPFKCRSRKCNAALKALLAKERPSVE